MGSLVYWFAPSLFVFCLLVGMYWRRRCLRAEQRQATFVDDMLRLQGKGGGVYLFCNGEWYSVKMKKLKAEERLESDELVE